MEDKAFTVINQQTTIAQLPDGSYGNVVRIRFRTRLGVVGQVDVPAASYSRDSAVAAIEAQAQHLDEVQAL